MNRRVVVTGVGAITPLGLGADALVDRWAAGESAIADGAARCDFDPAGHLAPELAGSTDRVAQLALVAAAEAVAQAGWSEDPPVAADRIGCVIGTGIGGEDASVAIARHHGIEGRCFGATSDCAGAHAVGAGMRMIQRGEADICLVGGSEAPLDLHGLGGADETSPNGDARPSDARRNGFVTGEGAGVLVLEAESVARARGARPLAIVAGYGSTGEPLEHDGSACDPAGKARAILSALADANRKAYEVDYVSADTSAPASDRSESDALKEALGGHARWIPVSSPKSAIGHLLGAAGAVEAVATVLALVRRTAPPTLGLSESENGLDLDYVRGVAHAIDSSGHPPLAISNNFGFGGDNAVLCLEAAA